MKSNFIPLKELPEGETFTRVGVLPFCVVKNIKEKTSTTFLLLSVSRYNGNCGDFGGGVLENEKVHETAARELKEETCGVFDFVPEYIRDLSMILYFSSNPVEELAEEFSRNMQLSSESSKDIQLMDLDPEKIEEKKELKSEKICFVFVPVFFEDDPYEGMIDSCNIFRDYFVYYYKKGGNDRYIEKSHILWIDDIDLLYLLEDEKIKIPRPIRQIYYLGEDEEPINDATQTGFYPNEIEIYPKLEAFIITSLTKAIDDDIPIFPSLFSE